MQECKYFTHLSCVAPKQTQNKRMKPIAESHNCGRKAWEQREVGGILRDRRFGHNSCMPGFLVNPETDPGLDPEAYMAL